MNCHADAARCTFHGSCDYISPRALACSQWSSQKKGMLRSTRPHDVSFLLFRHRPLQVTPWHRLFTYASTPDAAIVFPACFFQKTIYGLVRLCSSKKPFQNERHALTSVSRALAPGGLVARSCRAKKRSWIRSPAIRTPLRIPFLMMSIAESQESTTAEPKVTRIQCTDSMEASGRSGGVDG